MGNITINQTIYGVLCMGRRKRAVINGGGREMMDDKRKEIDKKLYVEYNNNSNNNDNNDNNDSNYSAKSLGDIIALQQLM